MPETNATNSVEPSPWSVVDTALIWLVAAAGTITTFVLLIIPRFYIPAEDSVILFQFSRNLANTGAITYIAHGPHAEGATDFAWMVLIAAGMKLHIDPYWLVSMVNVVSLLLLAVLLIKIAGSRMTALSILFIMGCFGLTTQYAASLQAFSTLPFACLVVLLVWAFLRREDALTAAVACLLCLFRPDGIVFAVPILVAALWLYPGRARRLAMDAALFIVPGLIYFFWRWHYFGHFLPLPFMVKSDSPRLAHIIVADSLGGCLVWTLFALPILAVVLHKHWRDARNRAVLLSVLVVPTIFYLMMRLDQNVGHRFFIYFPIGLALLVAMNWQSLALRRRWVLRVSLIIWFLLICPLAIRHDHGSWGGQCTTRKAVALDLAKLPHGTLLTTEAGVVPYYSQWPSYDSWGLNTAQFAEHLIQPADVVSLKPDLILMHSGAAEPECVAQADWETPYTTRTWDHMSRNVVAGAAPAHYDLWMLPLGNLKVVQAAGPAAVLAERECWFVRSDSPLKPAIVDIMIKNGGLPGPVYAAEMKATTAAAIVDTTPPTRKQRFISRLKQLWHAWI